MNASLLYVLTGILGGAMNALAGGGSFVTLSVLIAAGIPSVTANATSTVALFPGGAASAWVYRQGLGAIHGVPLVPTLLVTLVGGFSGSLLLLSTPSLSFDRVLPWILLLATLALMLGGRPGAALCTRLTAGKPTALTVQLLLGIYGGYFGGAVGLMMVAAWTLLKGGDIKAFNAPRALMVTAANAAAIVSFVVAGAVRWQAALFVATGALVGGYAGAHLGRRLDPALIRNATLLLSAAITAFFFVRAYG